MQEKFVKVAFSFIFAWAFITDANAQNAGASKAMNPDIGANFLLTAQKNTSKTSEGLNFQEAEFSFKSDVDPYFTAMMIFSVAPSATNSKEFTIEPEEVYVDTTFIPSLTLRAGKFYGFFGRHNILHTHAFPFIDAPLMNQYLLGDGLNDVGVSASLLIPTKWFSELTVQGFGNFKSLAHLRSLLDINDDSTVEMGVTAVSQWAWGADLTYKHRPTDRGQGRRFNLAAEWMSGHLDGFTTVTNANGTPTQGFDAYVQYEIFPRTYAQYRFDDVTSNSVTRHGILLGYAPSEFSVFRVQYDFTKSESVANEHRVIAQVNFTIGAHPAHDY